MMQGRVVNTSIKTPSLERHRLCPSPRVGCLEVLNAGWLRQRDGINNIAATNHEARTVVREHLASHPFDKARQNPTSIRLDPGPKADILFINNGNPRHPLTLTLRESGFTNRFHTIIIPVAGLMLANNDQPPRPALYVRDPLLPTATQLHNGVFDRAADKTFIALVGEPYRGNNLQMGDLEFISDAEVARVRGGWRERGSRCVRWLLGGKRRGDGDGGVAESMLRRDVLVMMVIWERWTEQAKRAHLGMGKGYSHVSGVDRPKLRFARVKEGCVDG